MITGSLPDSAAVSDGMGNDAPVLETEFAFLGIAAGQPDTGIGQHGPVDRTHREAALEQHVVPARPPAVGAVVPRPVHQGHGDQDTVAVRALAQPELRAAVEHSHGLPVRADSVRLLGERDPTPAAPAAGSAPLGLVAGGPAGHLKPCGVGVEAQSEGSGQPAVGLGHGVTDRVRVRGRLIGPRCLGVVGRVGELPLEVRLLRIERAHEVLPVGRRVEHLVGLAGGADELAGEVVDQLLARVHVSGFLYIQCGRLAGSESSARFRGKRA